VKTAFLVPVAPLHAKREGAS